ncbi:TetR/AcrR family transcriptional regulator C-terminal domain-containing protein [Acinetobacter nosocomialis]|uniref:TetR/AcrR family transcriptional regulator C-terminal domain-containing protein n=1 Tax=Acinetobacter nosocomialis TaxID=106654 RepID=UPI002576CFD1|nr:TetR/AcrR family transcriptional regulator C-terminal domain-containing protein [Acinetobacter nosocomialis]
MLNEEGIDSITTRKLAQRLGIKSPTLYWHFNKSLLMEAMAETIINEHHLVSLPIDGMTWQDWLLANSVSFRRALLAYRDGARLHARTSPSQGHFNTIEARCAVISCWVFPVEAVALLMTLGRFIVGWVLEEQEEIRSDPPFEADPTIYPLMLQGVNFTKYECG